MIDAILLIAHGSRRDAANAELLEVARALQSRTRQPVEPAYLELASPTIAQAAARCVERGARRVKVLPYFLSAGAHAVHDLRSHCQALSLLYPHVDFELCPPLGTHPKLIDVLCERLNETASGNAATGGGIPAGPAAPSRPAP